MAVEFTKQADELLKAAREARIPDNVKAIAEESLTHTRKAYDTLHSATREHAQNADTMVQAVTAHTRTIADTLLTHSATNAEATFNAAMKIVRAPTLPDAARLHAEFIQAQMATATAQTQELFQLSSKVANSTMEQLRAAATKMFTQVGQMQTGQNTFAQNTFGQNPFGQNPFGQTQVTRIK